MKLPAQVRLVLFVIASAAMTGTTGRAQTSPSVPNVANATGTVEGRVFNQTTGVALHNAIVEVVGTGLQTHTDEEGFYRISRVPTGLRRLEVSYSGLDSKTVEMSVGAAAPARADFNLEYVLQLDAITVAAPRLSQEGVALQEQRMAPNIKTVIAANEGRGEGNLGEYFKYTPGLVMNQNPQSPSDVAIRGMPSSGTLILSDGAQFATASLGTRATDMGLAAPGNIDRIEISKTPTPDIPANAVGGSINLITKTSFSRRTPLFNYNVFGTYTKQGGFFEDRGADSAFTRNRGSNGKISVSRIQPAIDLSYIRPINDSLGATFSVSKSSRFGDWPTIYPGFTQKQGTLSVYRNVPTQVLEGKLSAAGKVEWKLQDNTFALDYSYSNQRSAVRQNQIFANFGLAATGNSTFTENTGNTGVMGTGSLANNNQYKDLDKMTLIHKYRGKLFKTESGLSHSSGKFNFKDMADGFFNTVNASMRYLDPVANTLAAIRIRADYANGAVTDGHTVATLSAKNAAGTPLNVYDGNNYQLDSVNTNAQANTDQLDTAYINVSRDLGLAIPVTIKAGGLISKQKKEAIGGARAFSFAPPGGAAARTAGNYDLVSEGESSLSMFKYELTGQPMFMRYLSTAKIKRLYEQRPELFTEDLGVSWANKINFNKKFDEQITAAYVMGDVKLFNNRLRVVGGVRMEETQDDGRGPRNDLRATFQQDANGNLILNSAGAPIKVAGDALALAKLQYTERGNHAEYTYHDFYPSLNTNYSLNDFVVFRASYAKTIGRPDLANTIPGVTVPAPTVSGAFPTITVVDGRLDPWTADNYDLTAEMYRWKGVTASVSWFRKDVSKFFVRKVTDTTLEELTRLGLSDDYLGYTISKIYNGGEATVEGVEFNYRQSLGLLLPAAQGFDVFYNIAAMTVTGPNKNDFTNFTPKTASGGISYGRGKIRADLRFNHVGWRRTGISAESASVFANSYAYFAPQTKVDASVSYAFNRHYVVYFDVRNMFDEPQDRGVWAAETPEYTRLTLRQWSGAVWSFGVKGSF